MTAQPWQPAKYPGRVDDVIVTSDGPQRITLPPMRPNPATDPHAGRPRQRRRARILALVRRPSRTAQLEQLLDRYRWANTGLRERLAELEEDREAILNQLADLVDTYESCGPKHQSTRDVLSAVRGVVTEASR